MVEKSIANLEHIREENRKAESKAADEADNERLAEGQAKVAELTERRMSVKADLEALKARRADS